MLQIAIHYLEKGLYTTSATSSSPRRKPKLAGYQLTPANYRLLKLLTEVQDLPRSRIVDYHYILATGAPPSRGHYFLLPVTPEQLPALEAITRTEHGPRVYLWRDEQWWSFPQLETYRDGEMLTYTITTTEYGSLLNPEPNPQPRVETRQLEKTKVRVRPTYEPSVGPGFSLSTTPTQARPLTLPTTITGNGMVLEWKQGYTDKPACWWLRDAHRVDKAHSATYRHYRVLKSTPHARWSQTFQAWYYTGGAQPPATWLQLVGFNPDHSGVENEPLVTELLPPALLTTYAGQFEARFGNPLVWAKLDHPTEGWSFYVVKANLTDDTLYGYRVSYSREPAQLHTGEWLTLPLSDLASPPWQRETTFPRQSLRTAVEQLAQRLGCAVPPAWDIPTDAECRRRAFAEQQQRFLTEMAQQRQLTEAMRPYHQFQALLQFRQCYLETFHQLTHTLALPALATPALDDPWS